MREVRQQALLEEMLNDPAVKIQYASKYAGSTNAYKNAIGTNWAIGLRDFGRVKQDQQDRLLAWAEKNKQPQYAEALAEIERIVRERAGLRYRSWMLSEGLTRSIEFAGLRTTTAVQLAAALEQPDEAAAEKLKAQLAADYRRFADKNYNRAVDKKVARAMIAAYTQQVAKEDQPDYLHHLYTRFQGDTDAFVDAIFNNSLFWQ